MASITEEHAVQASIHFPSSSADPAVSETLIHITKTRSQPSSPLNIKHGRNTGRLDVQLKAGQLATPMRFKGIPSAMRTTLSESFPADDSCPMDVDDVEDVPTISIRTEWLGTSELHIDMSLDLQSKVRITYNFVLNITNLLAGRIGLYH